MAIVATVCALLVVLTTILHYETLRGLSATLPVLVGWSASYTYIAMERFWSAGK